MKEILFSVTIKDCDVQAYSSSGPGGQHRDHGNSAVRVIHRPSGARGESGEGRSQLENKKKAFVKMASSVQFQSWVNQMTGKVKTEAQIQAEVEKDLEPSNLRIEGKDGKRWVEIQPD